MLLLCIDAATAGEACDQLRQRVVKPFDWTADIFEDHGTFTRFWFRCGTNEYHKARLAAREARLAELENTP